VNSRSCNLAVLSAMTMHHPSSLIALSALHPDPTDEVAQALAVSAYYDQNFTPEEAKAIRDFRTAARTCYEQLSPEALSKLQKIGAEMFGGGSSVDALQVKHEQEMEASLSFWETVTKQSVSSSTLEPFDVKACKWLGNGKWGWVMAAKRKTDKKQVVIKLCDVKHADVCMKEWLHGYKFGRSHPNIVEYQTAFLYGDEHEIVKERLLVGYKEGKLSSDIVRKSYPSHYVCMTIEMMNCGSVQNWLDDETMTPEGMLVILQQVAAALAHMHENGVTHNDMKPENIFLHNDQHRGCITVKLGDLGLADISDDVSSDITRFGETGMCMATGEKFGNRKFAKDQIEEILNEVRACVEGCGLGGRLGSAMKDLPELLRKVLSETVNMAEVRDWKSLQGWDFLPPSGLDVQGDAEPEDARGVQPDFHTKARPSRSKAEADHAEGLDKGEVDHAERLRKKFFDPSSRK